ncbi:MAG: sulfatase-like hydrolase/transferase [Chthoniobacterales bacterium]
MATPMLPQISLGRSFALFTSAFAAWSLAGPAQAAPVAPNIIVIMADDAGLGDISAYRDFALEYAQTPAIDSLAETGLISTEAYTPAPMCWPTRGSLLTGRWPARWGNSPNVSDQYPRLGKLLQDAGYFTMMIGKTHNGVGEGDMPPTAWGWNRYFATFTQHDYFMTYAGPGLGEQKFTNAVGFGASLNNPTSSNRLEPVVIDEETGRYTEQGWLTREGWSDIESWREDAVPGILTIPYEWALRYGPVLEGRDQEPFEFVTDLGSYTINNPYEKREMQAGYLPQKFNEKGVEYVTEHLEENPDQPFFLYMPRSIPHVPVHAPPRELLRPERQELLGQQGDFAQRALVMDMVDQGVGDLVKLLKDKGIYENTIIIFCSDNGGNEAAMGKLRGRKGQLFEGGIRTPFVMSWPAGIPEDQHGSQSAIPITLMDLAPTFLSAAAAETTTEFDGVDLLANWQGKTDAAPERFADALFWGDGNKKKYAVNQTVRSADGEVQHRWKLVRQGGEEYLFDLKVDEFEENNLDNPEMRNHMRELVNAWLEQMGKSDRLEVDAQ